MYRSCDRSCGQDLDRKLPPSPFGLASNNPAISSISWVGSSTGGLCIGLVPGGEPTTPVSFGKVLVVPFAVPNQASGTANPFSLNASAGAAPFSWTDAKVNFCQARRQEQSQKANHRFLFVRVSTRVVRLATALLDMPIQMLRNCNNGMAQ